MPDPTIAMKVQTAQAPQTPMSNPLELMQGIMGLRRSALALQNEQNTLDARTQAGQIMANAPDVDTGLEQLRNNPLVGGFAPEIAGTLTANAANQIAYQQAQRTQAAQQKAGQIISKAPNLDAAIPQLLSDPETASYAQQLIGQTAQTNQTVTAIGGARQEQAQSGFGNLLRSFASGINDPSTVPAMAQAALTNMSPTARAQNTEAFNNVVHALTDGLPEGEAGKQMYQQRLTAMMIGAGVSPDQLRGITGTMAPGVSMQPVGEGGALVPVQTGGPVVGSNEPQILGQPGKPVQGQTQTQQTANTARGGVAGTIDNEMTAQSALVPALNRIDIMQDTLKDFQAGGGADMRARLGTALQAMKNAGLPVTDEMVNKVANSSLSATQIFDTEIKPLVLQSLRNDIAGTGRAMRTEVDSYLNSMDNTKDPQALMKLLNQARYQLQVGYDQSQKYVDFKDMQRNNAPEVSKYKDPSDFYAWYNKNYSPKNLPQQTEGGVSLAPRSNEGVKGIPQKENRPSLDSFFGK